MSRSASGSCAASGLLAALVAAGMAAGCSGGTMLKRGDRALELSRAQAFEARDLDGEPVTLAALIRRGPVMLVFLRGFS